MSHRRRAAGARSMYPQTSGAYPGDTPRAAGALSAWDAVGRLHRRRAAGALSMYPQSASAAYPGDTARGAGAAMSAWDAAAPVGLLHPETIAHLVDSFGKEVFESDPVMRDFLADFDLGGPMFAMKHLSNSHVTSRLVAMTASLR
ncbi:hypothetical protein JL720_11238 [Aureococcus anophagefferens]|nr:hypothetical protein JL720_11238 [Aureococcus anophagefferens]